MNSQISSDFYMPSMLLYRWLGVHPWKCTFGTSPVIEHVTLAAITGTFLVNSSPLGQNGHHFADDSFRCTFVNEKFCILIKIILKFVPNPGGGTPSMMGDTYVPRFWPPFLTLWVPNSIFLGCFFSSTNTKTIFWVQFLTKSDLFGPKIKFSPRSFWVQFSVAHGTPPAIFGPSTPPGFLSIPIDNNNPALVHIMVWRQTGDKALS